jgi:thioredoxin-dependent peroxiredoxin
LTTKRKGLIQVGGKDATVIGDDIKVGQKAPDFAVFKTDWTPIKALKETKGKVRILAPLPSLDTETCDRETRRFNQEAAGLGKDVAILVISTDLPYAQKRWCGAAGVDQVLTLSDSYKVDFGRKYACLIEERRTLRRAVFVVDRQGMVTYADYMPALGNEPKYDEVLAAAREALGK